MDQAARARAADGPYAEAAPHLAELGLSPIPCGGGDSKTPLIAWGKLRGVGLGGAARFAQKYGAANVGVLTGERSNVVIVDVDDPALLPTVLARCGETQLITRTPRCGFHCWYRFNGERNVQRLGGLNVDVRGEGGFVVVPPSVRPDGARYTFERGSWDDISRLPKARSGSLPVHGAPRGTTSCDNLADLTKLRAVAEGRRNDTLFRLLLREAQGCDSLEALLDCGHTINDDFSEPLPETEVEKTARSAWGCEYQDRNWVGREPRIVLTKAELMELADEPEALLLWQVLWLAHNQRLEPFAVSPSGMARAEHIKGWCCPKRYRRARNILLDRGKLILVHKGGRGAGDPSLYRLADVRVPKLHPMYVQRG